MPQTAVLVMGLPASGKSSVTEGFAARGFEVFSRDTAGGRVASLVPAFSTALAAGKSVVVDNLNLTVAGRAPFIAAAQAAGVPIECMWLQTSFPDSQVNALHRMWDRYGEIFLTPADIKAHAAAKTDPNIFPVGAMFAAKRRLLGVKKKGVWEKPCGKPTMAEGFSQIVKVPFTRRPSSGIHKALIVDYDGTLRRDAKELGGDYHFPTKVEEVQALPNRQRVLQQFVDDGYLLLGVTTQSGIARLQVSEQAVRECIAETNRQVGHDIEAYYCPHNVPPSCFCRKPQPGLGMMLVRKHELDPAQCIYVGDMKTDKTFAERCGFQFSWAADFFGAE